MPDVSIVMPVYNGGRFVSRTIESVLAQTKSDWELVIVDDGSTDESVSLTQGYAARDGRIRVVCQPNAGVAAARNRGFRATDASSPSVIFLDQDDVWERDALETLAATLGANVGAVAAHGVIHSMDDQGRPHQLRTYMLGGAGQGGSSRRGVVGRRPAPWPASEPTTLAVLALRNVITTPGQILIRRSALESAGLFDALMVPADDWDLWLRLSARGPIAFADKVVVGWRQHESNASHQKMRMYRAELRVYRKLLSAPWLTPEQRRVARLGYRWFRRDNNRMRWEWAARTLAQGQWGTLAGQIRHAILRRLRP